MKRWILIGAGILTAAFALASIFGKPDVIDVTDEYQGKGGIGRRFETTADLVVYQASGAKEPQFSPLGGDMPNREQLNGSFPMRWYGQKILGLLPSGTSFRIIGARRSSSSTVGNDYYAVQIESDGPLKGKTVCTRFIEHGSEGKLFDPKYAVEVTTGVPPKN